MRGGLRLVYTGDSFMPAKNGRVRHEPHPAPSSVSSPRTRVETFAHPLWDQATPLGQHFSSLVAGVKILDDDLKDYLEEPIAALPPAVLARLPHVCVVFVPFLETDGKVLYVNTERPAKDKQVALARLDAPGRSMVLFTMQEPNLGDFHYHFFRAISKLAAESSAPESLDRFSDLLVEEINLPVHGEVDEESWKLKQDLFERGTKVKKSTRGFAEYATSAFADTMTLYLHGLCCDIDVEPGPRQLPTRPLRKRLEVLAELYPPPVGYAVFPDDRPAGK